MFCQFFILPCRTSSGLWRSPAWQDQILAKHTYILKYIHVKLTHLLLFFVVFRCCYLQFHSLSIMASMWPWCLSATFISWPFLFRFSSIMACSLLPVRQFRKSGYHHEQVSITEFSWFKLVLMLASSNFLSNLLTIQLLSISLGRHRIQSDQTQPVSCL